MAQLVQSLYTIFTNLIANIDEKDLMNMTPDEVNKAIRIHRMKQYKAICFCGVVMMLWMDKTALLSKLYQYNHTAANICTLYFTFALVCMLLGVIASSFPDTAPCGMAVSWNGALQAFLFMNASFHLSIMELYPDVLHLTTLFMLTSVLFCVYWSFCARDPTRRLVEAEHHE